MCFNESSKGISDMFLNRFYIKEESLSNTIPLSTPVQVHPAKDKITTTSRILTLGSCFSDHMGNRLSDHFFTSLVNPFGTVFNPSSIFKLLGMALDGHQMGRSDIASHRKRYFHYDFHSSFDATTPDQVLDTINAALTTTGEFMRSADFLILTFGTRIVYRLRSENRLVSNCHKVPNDAFEKSFLPIEQMEVEGANILARLLRYNSNLKIILTVSPVRHTKEGMVENARSKSGLMELCHRLREKSDVVYFPSYEIMIDELRDYRYYKKDLIHPTELAIDWIWSRFMETFLEVDAQQKIEKMNALIRARNHIPFDRQSEDHQIFKANKLKKIETLKAEYPEADLSEIEAYFSR